MKPNTLKLYSTHIALICSLSSINHIDVSAARPAMLSPDSTFVADALAQNAPDGTDGVPKYLIWGKKDSFLFGVGGFAKVTLGGDFGNADLNPNAFITSELNPDAPKGARAFNISGQQTTLYLNFVALPGSDNQTGIFIMGNMLGDNYTPSLEEAFVSYRGIKAGYNYTIFSDNGAMPATIDYQGPNAATTIQLPEISYSLKFGKKKQWLAQLAVSIPQTSITCARNITNCHGRIPDVAAAVKFSWNDGESSAKAAVLYRGLSYRNESTGSFNDRSGWGVMTCGSSPVFGPLSVCWSGVYGKGVASYIQDLSDQGLDLTPTADGSGMHLTSSWGAYAGISAELSERVSVTGFYSHVRNYASKFEGCESSWGSLYKYGQYAGGNVIWQITPIISTGIEYLYGRRVDNNGMQNHCSRLQTMLQIDF